MEKNNWRFKLVANVYTQILIRIFYSLFEIFVKLPIRIILEVLWIPIGETLDTLIFVYDNYIKPSPKLASERAERILEIEIVDDDEEEYDDE